jgi:DNA adenine methylase
MILINNNLSIIYKKLNLIDYPIKFKNELNILITLIENKLNENKLNQNKLNKINESLLLIDNYLNKLNELNNKNYYIKPLIKWVGGKTQIINQIINFFPNIINNYHEIFLGGGSVLLALLQNIEINKIKVKGNIYAYDINETLINMYINIQQKPYDILINIKKIINIYNNLNGTIINRKPININDAMTSQESYFYWIRKEFNNLSKEEKKSPLGSSYFIFLNKICFRGVYREGPNGFNVPFGHYKNPEIINEEHLLIISKLIKDVIFIHSKFEKSFENIKKNDFIYLDPPYAPENIKSFVGYTQEGFNLEQHKLLFTYAKKYNFLMSNADVDLVRNNFSDKQFTINVISCKRSINSKNPGSKTNEVLIKSY